MSATLITVQCSYCKGSGMVETLLERTHDGEWVPNRMIDHYLADCWIASDKLSPLKWETCACPICNGEGSYELESVPCKIF